MTRFFWVCLAGAIGTGIRYLVGLFAAERFGTAFPYATLFVNVLGCLLLSFIVETAVNTPSFPPTVRIVLATGLMGGLTTYSSFNHEALTLARSGRLTSAFVYFAITTIACLGAGLAGIHAARVVSNA